MTNNPQQSIDALMEDFGVLDHCSRCECMTTQKEDDGYKLDFKAALKEVVDGIIGKKSHTATKAYAVEGTPWISEVVKEKAVNKKIDEQRKRAAEVFGEPQTNNGTHVPAGS